MTEKVLFIPDCHIPYEDKRAFDLMLRAAEAVRFNRVVILGDFADVWKLSFHERTLEKRMSFGREVSAVNKALDKIDALKIKHKHFVSGNHEFRFDRYLAERAPELADLPGHSVKELFRLEERGWTFTKYRDYLKIGKLYCVHDDGTAGPLACIKARSSFNANVVIGHVHAITVAYQGDARGKARVGASFGWLGSASRIDYLHRVQAARWSHGFGTGIMEDDGVVHLQAVPIINGKCCVFGKLYS